jgi:hypothetical protein
MQAETPRKCWGSGLAHGICTYPPLVKQFVSCRRGMKMVRHLLLHVLHFVHKVEYEICKCTVCSNSLVSASEESNQKKKKAVFSTVHQRLRDGSFIWSASDTVLESELGKFLDSSWKAACLTTPFSRFHNLSFWLFGIYEKCRCKAFPLQAWTGPWGSWRMRLQNF